MKTTMVIPTYWGRTSDVGWQEGDAVYDHATPLDENGTLLRTLESLKILEDRDFDLVLLGCATTVEIEAAVEEKLYELLKDAPKTVRTYVVTHSHLRQFRKLLASFGLEDHTDVLSLRGYPQVRNMCLFVPYALGSDVAVLIDDDEVFEDPKFMSKAIEFINRRYSGRTIDGVAGYYLNEDGNYYDKVVKQPWMTYWDRFGCKAEAFDKIIGQGPRLKPTPFAFGGAMVIHRNLFKHVPFDPKITRGEDTDYVLNARMFGFNFFLDNTLNIKHLPPPKKHPVWKRFREDILRLRYDAAKIAQQHEEPNMEIVKPEDFDPYPGAFLKDDLEDKIFKTNLILALDYLSNNDMQACKEAIKNIWISKNEAVPDYDVFSEYVAFQKKWRHVIGTTKRHRGEFLNVILRSDTLATLMLELEEKEDAKKLADNGNAMSSDAISTLEFFQNFDEPCRKVLIEYMLPASFNAGEVVIKEGGDDFTLFIVRAGQLRVTRNQDGEEVRLATIGRGKHVGDVGLLTGLSATTDVIADRDSLLLALEKKAFDHLMTAHADIGMKLLAVLGREMGLRLRDTSDLYVKVKAMERDVSETV